MFFFAILYKRITKLDTAMHRSLHVETVVLLSRDEA